MTGLYIHIPFCRKVCYYCDFHFTVSLKQKVRVMNAIHKELSLRSDECSAETMDTIYIGGGTPSLLDIREVVKLFVTVYHHFRISSEPEITFEANPDDLQEDYLKELKNNTPVNRLSIGIQSFTDRDLSFLNRRHNALEGIQSVCRSKKNGFGNLNVDLIYGIPGMSQQEWQHTLDTFHSLDVPHLSAYHLSIEPKTVFGHYQKKGMLQTVSEETSREHIEMLIDFAGRNGYDHYEISNFAKPGFYSRHNVGYWTGKHYIGFGPSAHSYLNGLRRWNIANNTAYCNAIENDRRDYFETEEIDTGKAYNEYVLTGLRTKWGIDLDYITNMFGQEKARKCSEVAGKFVQQGSLSIKNSRITLSRSGFLIADYIIRELMIV